MNCLGDLSDPITNKSVFYVSTHGTRADFYFLLAGEAFLGFLFLILRCGARNQRRKSFQTALTKNFPLHSPVGWVALFEVKGLGVNE